MKTRAYEDWMRPQVVAMFGLKYETGDSADHFQRIFEHPFQRAPIRSRPP